MHDDPLPTDEPTANIAAVATSPGTPPDVPPAVTELSPAACAARLAGLFPAVFAPGQAKPLKLRIQADIQQRAPGTFTKKALSIFLHRHTTSTAYLKALVQAPGRFDLDGAPAGELSDEHRQAAVAELERRRALHDARRAAERDAQRAAQRAERDEAARARSADDEARRSRAVLLHAYETSTLTRANFCALKGMTESELDALLVTAKRERESRPLPPVTQRPPPGEARATGPRPNRGHDRPPERGPLQRPPADARASRKR
jgi:ProP effector